ncbi:hypothetical protein ACLKA6_013877 [Drosophila palustris]
MITTEPTFRRKLCGATDDIIRLQRHNSNTVHSQQATDATNNPQQAGTQAGTPTSLGHRVSPSMRAA